MSTVITVENLGKKYTLHHQQREQYTALRDVITNGVRTFSKKIFSPFNSQSSPLLASEEFWALKDVSFDVKQGDRIGIIGRNGAGKSTLLKILSRITEPTTGRVKIKGRVASLLEVGTGFHPELTGRENIFLNGAILGMGRAEIKKKFDEIVDFAEIEKFLDTPVKRYSSGMYVRLAFAVAANLEPEILVVDEVLAVGDAQFQKKCLGKIESISTSEGRTVLFVSHQMGVIQSLCGSALLLENGRVVYTGPSVGVVAKYLHSPSASDSCRIWEDGLGDASIRLLEARILNSGLQESSHLDMKEDLFVELRYQVARPLTNFRIGFRLLTVEGIVIFTSENADDAQVGDLTEGTFLSRACIPGNFLNKGKYLIAVAGHVPFSRVIFSEENCLSFTVEHLGGVGGSHDDNRRGVVRPRLSWQKELIG